jgi:hypothetical protein
MGIEAMHAIGGRWRPDVATSDDDRCHQPARSNHDEGDN